MIRFAALLMWLFCAATAANSHAFQPGYLEMRAIDEQTWSIYWRKPDVQGQPMSIDARLSDGCDVQSGPEPSFDGEGWSASWITRCPDGLRGETITIDGLEETRTDVLVRYELEAGVGQAWRLVPSDPSFVIPETPGAMQVLWSYFVLGVEHILFGFDHLLFVLALLLLIPDLRRLIGAITAFTVSHSITLGAALGWLNFPGPPVEAIIAISIVFLASEVLRKQSGQPGLSERAPWVVAFGFGLIHGLGFGSALSEIGLPESEIVLALLAFNIGVEIGQVLFICVCMFAWTIGLRNLIGTQMAGALKVLTVYAIGGLAAFWTVERVVSFWA